MGCLGRRTVFWIVAVNQVVCATVFFPWFRPRETVSGLMGRWRAEESGWKYRLGRCVANHLDRTIHCTETCYQVYLLEEQARRVLYPDADRP